MTLKKAKNYFSDLFKFIGLKGKLFILFCFLLIIAIILSTCSLTKHRASDDISFNYSTAQKMTQNMQTKEKRARNYAYGLSFPQYNIGKIDRAINKQNKTIIKNFVSKYKHFSATEKSCAVMTANYQEYHFDKYNSIVRNIEYKIPNEKSKIIKHGLFVSADDKKVFDYEKVFSEDFNTYISNYAQKILKNKYHLNNQSIEKLLKNKDSFSEFVFIDSNVLFYIQSEDNTTYEISVKTTEINQYLNNDLFTKEVMATVPAETTTAQTIDPKKPMIALTFDDGPKASSTKRILETLKKHHAKATFFVLGSCAEENEENKSCIKLANEIGCEIGNHTYNHTNLIKVSVEEAYQSIQKTSDIVKSIINKETYLVRPPFGNVNMPLRNNLKNAFVMWSVDTKDWQTHNASSTVSNILANVSDGSIVLMHDIYSATADAVDIVVPQLLAKGYQLVTVSELLKYKNISENDGYIYYSANDIRALGE